MSPLAGSPGVIRLNFVTPAPTPGLNSVPLQAAIGTFVSNTLTLAVAP
jgi:hypothetical protein